MTDELMAEAVRRTAGRVPLEASGGITLERAARIGATGVDFVSVGALTHSVVVFDIGMDLVESVQPMTPARRRHRQQPHLPRPLDGEEVTAHWRVEHRRAPHGRRVVGADPRAAGRAGRRRRRHRGVRDGARGPARVARDARAPLRRRHRDRRRARRAHRHPGADGQPARGRLRPDRELPRGRDAARRARDRRRLRHRDDVRRGQRQGPVRRRRDLARHRDLPRGARPPRRPAAQGRARCGRGR